MDITSFFEVFASVGFPVAVCGVLLWLIYDSNKMHKAEVKNLTATYEKQVMELIEKHQAECKQLSDALNNNTIVMTQILEHMRKDNMRNGYFNTERNP